MIGFDLIFRWFHILAAMTLVGGIFFQRFALAPALRSLDGDAQTQLEEACRSRWAKLVMLTSGLLLVTGLVNAVRIILRDEFEGEMYPLLLMVKLMVALAIFWIAAVLSGRSSMAVKFREKSTFWLNVNVALAILIVCVAGCMKVTKRTTAEAIKSSSLRQRVEMLEVEPQNPPARASNAYHRGLAARAQTAKRASAAVDIPGKTEFVRRGS